jgi:chromosome segregation protein
MKIKKLELVGFKSFVDRTVVHFDHDVLGIVGPNGCGKSNIVDAIRWCMGEQSAKHLRGRAMEDVIFSGSESRAGHEFAEVTLTFDNDDPRDLPLEYKEYAEVAVTRRLDRTGNSEYLINKTQVRLKDVTDLFLGTGAGTKAYSIVEQGKIGLIVSAKPEDRRLLIEEAAGITKFKSRKRAAERKIELTQQNLLRVGDIVAEIERNLGSLKRQAAKAERYIAYRGELEDLQLHEASHRYLEIVGWIKLESSEVERLGAEAEQARTVLATHEAELEAARQELQVAEQALESAQNASFGAENEVRAEEAAIERAKDKMTALRHREDQAAGEAHEIAEQAARLAHERDVVAGEVAAREHEEELEAERVAREEAALAELSDEHDRAAASVVAMRDAMAKAQADIASAEARLGGFERRKGEMEARLTRVCSDREALDGARVDHAARAKELAQGVEDLRAGRVTSAEEKARLEARLGDLRQQVLADERALEDVRAELSKRRSRLGALEEMHARLEGVGAGARTLMATKDRTLVGLVADRIEAPAELTHALAGLLGSRLENVVVRDVARGLELLEEMASARTGRATIVPLRPRYVAGAHALLPKHEGVVARLADRLRFAPEDEALVQALVGDAVVVRDVEAARGLRATGVDAPLVTLGGTVLHADGRVSGGQGEEVAAGMLESKREARELAKEVERLDRLVAQRLAAHQASRAEMVETGSALDGARHRAHADELALVTTEKDLRQAETQLADVARRLDVMSTEEDDLTRAIAEAAVERAEAQRVLDEARGVVETVSATMREAEARATSWREKVEAQRSAVTEKKVTCAGTREKLAAARGTLGRLTRSTEELAERARRLDEELVANARTFGETAALVVAHREELHAALDRARAAADELARVRSEFDALRAQLVEREANLKELRAKVNAVREELAAHEMKLREQQIEMDHLLAGVAEKFRGVHLPRIVGDYHMRAAPDDVSRSRVEELMRLIERMGSVNLDAMRELEESEKRYEFYTTQKADLEKALADLQRAIQQMNRESRRLFFETFEAVNAKFQEIFPRMFRGGRAALRMTNPDDLLETGIDILAQPPGKKLSNIELMSGGEKALTAVSLIFAIFQVKPSPFCVLDEVDAPLDEANVARYNDLVRSMTDRSQFILITHHKRTMQMVDVLYGVTMPESGVSKLVSVKMGAEAEKREPAHVAVA